MKFIHTFLAYNVSLLLVMVMILNRVPSLLCFNVIIKLCYHSWYAFCLYILLFYIHLLFNVHVTLLYKGINLQDLINNLLNWDSPTAMVQCQILALAIWTLFAETKHDIMTAPFTLTLLNTLKIFVRFILAVIWLSPGQIWPKLILSVEVL